MSAQSFVPDPAPGAASTWFVMPLFNESAVVSEVIRDLRRHYPLVVLSLIHI